ncbi:tripartite tricarboxylate transporter substrate binding protein [Rhodobacteraceae bacterium R_SAG2]|nr:tripartite tricarboxylate transporter substrate binding protein [Rhodobacteraceae bacterium R_SAG2]
MQRRTFAATALAITAITATGAMAQDYPTRPITMIVPHSPGGGVDTYARTLAAQGDDVVSVPMAIVNRPGSGGLNGAQSVKRARPDGYTAMIVSGGSLLLSTMVRDTDVNAIDDFEFVAQIGDLTTALMVPEGSPYETVQDLITAAKEKPGELRWAHSGRGSFHHVAGVGFLEKNGIEAQDVPFGGGGPARAALIGSQVDFAFLGIQQLAGFEGQLNPLGLNAAERDSIMAQVPTLKEQGVPYAVVSSPVLMLAPKGTPAEALEYLETASETITSKPGFAEALSKAGTAPGFATGLESQTKLETMSADVAPLVEAFK